MQDQADVEVMSDFLAGLLSGELPQEIGGVRQGIVGRKRLLPVPYPMPGRDHRRETGYEPDSLPDIGLPGFVIEFRVSDSQHRDACLEHIHWIGLLWKLLKTLQNESRHIPRLHNLPFEPFDFALLRAGIRAAAERPFP